MLPFTTDAEIGSFENDEWVYLPGIRAAVESGAQDVTAYVIRNGKKEAVALHLPAFTQEERTILLRGCLINHYRAEL